MNTTECPWYAHSDHVPIIKKQDTRRIQTQYLSLWFSDLIRFGHGQYKTLASRFPFKISDTSSLADGKTKVLQKQLVPELHILVTRLHVLKPQTK